MSRENVEIIRTGYEACNRGDLDAATEDFHPDIEWIGPDVVPEKRQVHRGIEGVRRFWGSFPHVWTIRGGEAVRLEMFRTRAEAIEAVGLSE